MPCPRAAEMPTTSSPWRLRAARNASSRSAAPGEVQLVGDDERGLLQQPRVAGLELVADDAEVALRVRRGEVHDVDEHPGPLDVTQERVAQPGARRGALDEPGQVGEGDAPMVGRVEGLEVEHAEVGLERREGVGRDARRGGGERREERALAGVGQADEADVGDEPQLQDQRPRSSPGSPFWACFGAWWVAVAKWVLPRPPWPPRATITRCPGDTRSAMSAAVARRARRCRVAPAGRGPSPALPWRREPSPRPPAAALKWCLKR